MPLKKSNSSARVAPFIASQIKNKHGWRLQPCLHWNMEMGDGGSHISTKSLERFLHGIGKNRRSGSQCHAEQPNQIITSCAGH